MRTARAVQLVRSVTLSVRVEDPGKHLDTHLGKTKEADVDLGFLTAQGLYQSARLRSKKAVCRSLRSNCSRAVPTG